MSPGYHKLSRLHFFLVLLPQLPLPGLPRSQVVAETMVTLGMSAHTDRLLRLMVENGVTNTAVLERHLVIF